MRDAISDFEPLIGEDEEALVAKGIFLVRRIAFALPPEASLQEALREHFIEGLAALREEAGPTSPDPVGTKSRAA